MDTRSLYFDTGGVGEGDIQLAVADTIIVIET